MAQDHSHLPTDGVQIERGSASVVGSNSGTVNNYNTFNPLTLVGTLRLTSNVPAPPRHYVARNDLMASLEKAIWGDGKTYVTGQSVASGDGGQGKTVLAQAYAHQFSERYPGGRFIVGCESGDLTTALGSLFPANTATQGLNDQQRARLVREYLSQPQRCLLILDNVEDDDQWSQTTFRTQLPQLPCHILITTRAERLSGVDAVNVGRLSEPEAIELLGRFVSSAREDRYRTSLQAILREIEYLAGAVAAVGALMSLDNDDDWGKYAEDLVKAKLDDFADRAEPVRREIGYAGKTAIVLDDLRERLYPAELRVVDYAALLPADQIVPIWLEELLAADAEESKGENWLDLGKRTSGQNRTPADVLSHLKKLDLLRPAAEGSPLLSLHRLHRRRASERLAEAPELRNQLLDDVAGMAQTRAQASHDSITNKMLRAELTPLISLSEVLRIEGRIDASLSVANWLHFPLESLGRYHEDLRSLQRFTEKAEAILKLVGPTEMTIFYSHFAQSLADLGDLNGAKIQMEKAIAINERQFGPRHPTLATSYSNLATILKNLGELELAKVQIERAILIGKKHFDPDHPTLATSYSNLATILKELGDLSGAKIQIERAIAISEKHFDPDHPTLATQYSNLAMILRNLGDLKGAKTQMERTIAIDEKHFDSDHPMLATSYNNMAWIDVELGKLDDAQQSLEKAARICAKHFQPEHPTRKVVERGMAHLRRLQATQILKPN